MIISLSTGCVHRWTDDLNERIEICKQFDVDSFEVGVIKLEYLEKEITEANLKFLARKKFNTIHAPIYGIDFDKDEATNKALADLKRVYKKIKAINILFHPHNIIDPSLILSSGMRVSIENMRLSRKIPIEEIESWLLKFPKFGLTLDINHAATFNIEEIQRYFDKFKNRIYEVHLSCFQNNIEHQPIHTSYTEYIQAIKPIKHLDVPVVLETSIPKNQKDLIEKDIEFLKVIL